MHFLYILLSERITEYQVDAAKQMFVDFCSLLPELYDDKICTHNTHLLTHLPKYVKLWGPLWTHSGFGMEIKMDVSKDYFTEGTKFINSCYSVSTCASHYNCCIPCFHPKKIPV